MPWVASSNVDHLIWHLECVTWWATRAAKAASEAEKAATDAGNVALRALGSCLTSIEQQSSLRAIAEVARRAAASAYAVEDAATYVNDCYAAARALVCNVAREAYGPATTVVLQELRTAALTTASTITDTEPDELAESDALAMSSTTPVPESPWSELAMSLRAASNWAQHAEFAAHNAVQAGSEARTAAVQTMQDAATPTGQQRALLRTLELVRRGVQSASRALESATAVQASLGGAQAVTHSFAQGLRNSLAGLDDTSSVAVLNDVPAPQGFGKAHFTNSATLVTRDKRSAKGSTTSAERQRRLENDLVTLDQSMTPTQCRTLGISETLAHVDRGTAVLMLPYDQLTTEDGTEALETIRWLGQMSNGRIRQAARALCRCTTIDEVDLAYFGFVVRPLCFKGNLPPAAEHLVRTYWLGIAGIGDPRAQVWARAVVAARRGRLRLRPGHKVESDFGTEPTGADCQAVRSSVPEQGAIDILLRGPRLWAWQQEALQAWRKCGRRGIVQAVTGSGKTMVGVVAAVEALASHQKVCILVPGKELQRQWVEMLRASLPNGTRIGLLGDGHQDSLAQHDVLVAIIDSARTSNLALQRGSGLLVGDECHRYGSDVNRLALDRRFAWRLGLSATYERTDDGHSRWLTPYFGDLCFELDYRTALAEEVIAHFKVALIGCRFNAQDASAYQYWSRKASRAMHVLIHRYRLTPEPFGEFMKRVGVLKAMMHEDPEAALTAIEFLRAFARQRELLAETDAKTHAVAKVVGAVREANRTIVFTQTIRAAEDLAQQLRHAYVPAMAISSGMAGNERKRALDQFRTHALQAIVAPKVLDEGVDLPEADLGLIVAASRTRRQMIQRMGRVLRRKSDGRLARFAVLFIEGTGEDPNRGAHEAFLEGIRAPVADEERIFGADCNGAEICGYLNDWVPTRPPRQPRMPGEPRRT